MEKVYVDCFVSLEFSIGTINIVSLEIIRLMKLGSDIGYVGEVPFPVSIRPKFSPGLVTRLPIFPAGTAKK